MVQRPYLAGRSVGRGAQQVGQPAWAELLASLVLGLGDAVAGNRFHPQPCRGLCGASIVATANGDRCAGEVESHRGAPCGSPGSQDQGALCGRRTPGCGQTANHPIGVGVLGDDDDVLGADSGPGGHSAFVWGWVLKRLFPEDPIIDYCYKIGLQTANFDVFDGSDDETNYGGKIHYNTRNLIDLMLLCATDGARDGAGNVIDYQQTGLPEALKKNPMAWKDMNRGLARVRSGWDKDAIVISYECRSDVFYGGHETPEQGDCPTSNTNPK